MVYGILGVEMLSLLCTPAVATGHGTKTRPLPSKPVAFDTHPPVSALETRAGYDVAMRRYLDRPVFQAERVAAAAWTVGGAEAEREARTRQGELNRSIFVWLFASPYEPFEPTKARKVEYSRRWSSPGRALEPTRKS